MEAKIQSEGEENREAIEQGYDPQWRNSLVLLDYLTQHAMIARDLRAAELGQFVLVTGSLAISDLGILRSMWDIAGIQRIIVNSMTVAQSSPLLNRQDRRREERGAKSQPDATLPLEVQLALDVLKVLPHSLQARIEAGDYSVWCGLRQDSLVMASSDILLKHGSDVAGRWTAVGVLDAQPDSMVGGGTGRITTDSTASEENPLKALLSGLIPLARTLLGRPTHAFAITPLLIFRQVSA